METKFTKGVVYFSDIINKVEKGSFECKLMCALKYKYLQDFRKIKK